MMNERNEKLNKEYRIGLAAQNAYDAYLKDFIDREDRMCYISFTTSISEEQASETWRYQLTIRKFETAILCDIDNGNIAQAKLKGENK